MNIRIANGPKATGRGVEEAACKQSAAGAEEASGEDAAGGLEFNIYSGYEGEEE